MALHCPVKLMGETTCHVPAAAIDLSDGGMLLSLAAEAAPPVGSAWHVRLAVPRTTSNTYMLEEFLCEGLVLRHQKLKETGRAAVALRFASPLHLDLDA